MLRNSTELNDIINKKLDMFSSFSLNNIGLSNESTNVSSFSNPVESVSLHYCRSARGINQSDSNPGSLFDLPVQVNPKAVLDLYSDIKKKGLARRIVKRKKIRYENKRTVVRVKRKKIVNAEDIDTLNDWKSLLRRKKEDIRRVLIKRVKAKKRDAENEIKSTKSKQRIIVNKIRGHLRNLTDNEKKRIRIRIRKRKRIRKSTSVKRIKKHLQRRRWRFRKRRIIDREMTTPGDEYMNVTDKSGKVVARYRRRRKRQPRVGPPGKRNDNTWRRIYERDGQVRKGGGSIQAKEEATTESRSTR
ncbi:hypothetical protein Smp_186610 [Schistosoma mansoni]|uniref:hypothetical protein n=1 Tax=Schistosoma mansoni TaxID=6183 RepID=UPI00022C835F|nr:hypothetical protein Smp_186610 [Schistosoma mansoni]|eukprot:XP_018647426.1 hypothetical protein Smp_186610 [Schistosoma mansoni]